MVDIVSVHSGYNIIVTRGVRRESGEQLIKILIGNRLSRKLQTGNHQTVNMSCTPYKTSKFKGKTIRNNIL